MHSACNIFQVRCRNDCFLLLQMNQSCFHEHLLPSRYFAREANETLELGKENVVMEQLRSGKPASYKDCIPAGALLHVTENKPEVFPSSAKACNATKKLESFQSFGAASIKSPDGNCKGKCSRFPCHQTSTNQLRRAASPLQGDCVFAEPSIAVPGLQFCKLAVLESPAEGNAIFESDFSGAVRVTFPRDNDKVAVHAPALIYSGSANTCQHFVQNVGKSTEQLHRSDEASGAPSVFLGVVQANEVTEFTGAVHSPSRLAFRSHNIDISSAAHPPKFTDTTPRQNTIYPSMDSEIDILKPQSHLKDGSISLPTGGELACCFAVKAVESLQAKETRPDKDLIPLEGSLSPTVKHEVTILSSRLRDHESSLSRSERCILPSERLGIRPPKGHKCTGGVMVRLQRAMESRSRPDLENFRNAMKQKGNERCQREQDVARQKVTAQAEESEEIERRLEKLQFARKEQETAQRDEQLRMQHALGEEERKNQFAVELCGGKRKSHSTLVHDSFSADDKKRRLHDFIASNKINAAAITGTAPKKTNEIKKQSTPIMVVRRHVSDTKEATAQSGFSYDISPCKNSDSEDEIDETRSSKRIPEWARTEALVPVLTDQAGVDPDQIFPNPTKTCSLDDVFTGGKSADRRGSSGNWFHDRLTWKEELSYKRDMGFVHR